MILEITLDLKERVVLLSSGTQHVVLVSETGTVREWNHSAQRNIPRWVRFSSTVVDLREILAVLNPSQFICFLVFHMQDIQKLN